MQTRRELKMVVFIIVFVLFLLLVLKFKNSSKYSHYPPGPISFPVVGSILSLGTRPHEKLSQWKIKYGNIISIDLGSYRSIVVNDYELIKKVLSHKEIQRRPDTEAAIALRGKNLSGIVFSSGKANEEQRAFVLKTLKNFGMGKKSIEWLFVEERERLFLTLDQQVGKSIRNEELFMQTAVSALWNILAGEHGKVHDSEFATFLHEIRRMEKYLNLFNQFFPTIAKLFPSLSGWNQMVEASDFINDFSDRAIMKHKKAMNLMEEPKNLTEAYLHKIENTDEKNSTFFQEAGLKNLRGVLADFFAAGTETVAGTLTWFLAVCIYYPEIQTKLQEEIDNVIGKNRVPNVEDRPMLPYVEALIFEIFRYSALVPLALPHETSEEVQIEDYVIPKGTVVLPNAYDALHDPKLWEEPEIFNPDRFLTPDGLNRNLVRIVDLVFGHGKRICPGEAIAKDQLFLFISGLGQRYIFKKDPQFEYPQKIKVEMALTMLPSSHAVIINKR